MTNIDEIVRALRYCASDDAYCPCKWAEDNTSAVHCEDRLFLHAADAIEALQSENISLRAERDALKKCKNTAVEIPIEPRGVVE